MKRRNAIVITREVGDIITGVCFSYSDELGFYKSIRLDAVATKRFDDEKVCVQSMQNIKHKEYREVFTRGRRKDVLLIVDEPLRTTVKTEIIEEL